MPSDRWAIGIDPGFTETGVVLRRMGPTLLDVVAHKVYRSSTGPCTFDRCERLALKVNKVIDTMIIKYGIRDLEIAIERPIYNQNPDTFEKQWRLFQHIMAYRKIGNVLLDIDRCAVVEVPPTTSKRLATGNGAADKDQIALASPFEHKSRARHTWWTLADAWAHSLAAYGGCEECVRYEL